MSDLQVFGPIVLATDVEDAVTNTLNFWLDTYLRWIERAKGLQANWLPDPVSITVSNDLDHWPEEGLPAIQIISPGLADRPKRHSRVYTACWTIALAIFVSADNRMNSERLAKYYAGAVRALMVQQGGLNPTGTPFATATSWLNEGYDTHEPDDDHRTLGRAIVHFSVEVDASAQTAGGPTSVPTNLVQPAADLPAVQDVDTGITTKPLSLPTS